jgi:hypothetical protein
MLLVAMPMWGLYETAIVIARINDRRRGPAGDEPDYDELEDEEASSISGASTIDPPSAVDDADD